MEHVIAVYEENHGLLGIAKDYKHAVDFLIEEDFLDLDLEIDESGTTLSEQGITEEKIKKMSLIEFNQLYDGHLYLVIEKVH